MGLGGWKVATAKAYDQWEDPGLAFSDVECAEYDPQAWADQHVEGLASEYRVLLRKEHINGMDNPAWLKEARTRLASLIRWFCVAMEIDALPDEAYALPKANTSLGRRLTITAQELDEAAWAAGGQARVRADLARMVTLGRRVKLSKAERSYGNKLANCLTRELAFYEKMEQGLRSR
jgi:hypothetical protein